MNGLIKLLFILTITVMISVIDVTNAMTMRRQQGNYTAAADEYYAARLATSINKILANDKAKLPPRRFPLTCQNNPMICKDVAITKRVVANEQLFFCVQRRQWC
ncbi:hypothetical protein MKX01_012059 [Papaver californicum]|nr:hypothetical protein MKX01_012059 [Papaver californicum]